MSDGGEAEHDSLPALVPVTGSKRPMDSEHDDDGSDAGDAKKPRAAGENGSSFSSPKSEAVDDDDDGVVDASTAPTVDLGLGGISASDVITGASDDAVHAPDEPAFGPLAAGVGTSAAADDDPHRADAGYGAGAGADAGADADAGAGFGGPSFTTTTTTTTTTTATTSSDSDAPVTEAEIEQYYPELSKSAVSQYQIKQRMVGFGKNRKAIKKWDLCDGHGRAIVFSTPAGMAFFPTLSGIGDPAYEDQDNKLNGAKHSVKFCLALPPSIAALSPTDSRKNKIYIAGLHNLDAHLREIITTVAGLKTTAWNMLEDNAVMIAQANARLAGGGDAEVADIAAKRMSHPEVKKAFKDKVHEHTKFPFLRYDKAGTFSQFDPEQIMFLSVKSCFANYNDPLKRWNQLGKDDFSPEREGIRFLPDEERRIIRDYCTDGKDGVDGDGKPLPSAATLRPITFVHANRDRNGELISPPKDMEDDPLWCPISHGDVTKFKFKVTFWAVLGQGGVSLEMEREAGLVRKLENEGDRAWLQSRPSAGFIDVPDM